MRDVAARKDNSNVADYTRKCIRAYDEERFKKFLTGVANSLTLVDILIKIAEDARDVKENSSSFRRFWRKKGKTRNAYDSFDRKAFIHINQCCKRNRALILEYYRFYKDVRRGYVDFYLTCVEEDVPEEF
jgi:hypothetical protein